MHIVICEDSVLLREGLVRLLEHNGHTVTAALPDASSLMETLQAETVDLLIVDVRLPPSYTDEGIRAALQVRKQHPRLALLVLSQYVEERYAAELIATNTDRLGYLLKDRVTDIDGFLSALEQIHAGGTLLDPEVVAQLLTRRRHDQRMQSLTERERSVLAAMAEGKSNSGIAEALYLSEASVEKYITSIFTKLGLDADGSGNRRVLATLAHLESTTHEGPQS